MNLHSQWRSGAMAHRFERGMRPMVAFTLKSADCGESMPAIAMLRDQGGWAERKRRMR